jgi:ATP-dependent Clp protease adaptor protein ClpS
MTTAPVPATPEAEVEEALDRLYHLVLLDDDDHTYEYVLEMLGRIFGYSREKAFALARIVDSEGRVVLETAALEQVERHRDAIHGFGADPRIPTSKGSMSAVIEEAP